MFLQSHTAPETAPAENLHRLLILRAITIGGEVIVLALAILKLEMALPVIPIAIIISAHGVINGISWLRLHRPRPVTMREFFAQLVLDVLALSALLYFAGGSTNPFVSLLLLPLVIVATTLPRRYVWSMAVLIVASYSLLMIQYSPLLQVHSHHGGNDFNLHVLGMWFGFLLGVGMIIFFVVKMADSLREREHTLAEAREQALRDEQMVALGTLAAGAAHELGTPLSTMAVLSKEMEQIYQDPKQVAQQELSELPEKLRILRQQVDRCKETLSVISAATGQLRAESGSRVALDVYLQEVLSQWHNMRPTARIEHHFHGSQPAPQIVAERVLSQAIISILNNAADASIEDIELEGRWDKQQLIIEISDRGSGLSEDVSARVGKTLFTTKEEGQGVGLFLAHSVVKRLGGSVRLSNREGGGVHTCIELPLDKLLVTP
ncbi:Sensor histidine kinase PrrB (RegB) [hydrothermal vent metagenome]|uniref:histidine kinase n=1 Tax=hydrothermal vent metagenome TaxID=652676 RepID=A0A3B1BZ75_9ZZZZ